MVIKWGQLYFPITALAEFGKRKRNNPKINIKVKFLGLMILLIFYHNQKMKAIMDNLTGNFTRDIL